MSGEEKDVYDSENKQIVRERLWAPCLTKIILEINSWTNLKRHIRYLCFPGPNYLFLDYLIKNKLIPIESIVVGVEKDIAIAIKIRPEIKKLLPNYLQYDDFFETIVSEHEGFKGKFPFDFAELDFTKFVLETTNGEGTLPFIIALNNFFSLQLQNFNKETRITGFYLTITSKVAPWVYHEIFKKFEKNPINIWLEKVIKPFNSLLNHPYLNDILSKKKPYSEETKDNIIIISLILVVMQNAFDYFLINLINKPICYIGSISKMATIVFYCKKKTKAQLGSASSNELLRKKNFRNAVYLCENTSFLPKPSK